MRIEDMVRITPDGCEKSDQRTKRADLPITCGGLGRHGSDTPAGMAYPPACFCVGETGKAGDSKEDEYR